MRLPDLNDLIQDLQLAKDIAIKNENVNGLVNATMSQAKLLGLASPTPINPCNNDIQSISDLMDEIADDSNEVIRTIVDPVNNTTQSY